VGHTDLSLVNRSWTALLWCTSAETRSIIL